MIDGFPSGSLVILHLVNPKEKFWGTVVGLSQVGVTFTGINLESFDDWVRQLARKDTEPTLGLATMFVPLFRIERLFLDETVGAVRSYSAQFEESVGLTPAEYLGLTTREQGDAAN